MVPGAHTSCILSDRPMSKEALKAVERRTPPPSPRNRKCSWVGFLKRTKEDRKERKAQWKTWVHVHRPSREATPGVVNVVLPGRGSGQLGTRTQSQSSLGTSLCLLICMPRAYITHLGSKYIWKHCKALGHNEPPKARNNCEVVVSPSGCRLQSQVHSGN